MNMVRILIVSLCSVVTLGVTPAFADFMNGKDLEKNCRSSDMGEAMYCAGYLAAMYDSLKLLSKGYYEDYNFCPPQNMDVKEIATAVGKYIDTLSASDRERYSASSLISTAIALKFPCSSSSGGSSGSSGTSRGAAPAYSENPFAK